MNRLNRKLVAFLVFAAVVGSFNICFLHPKAANASQMNIPCSDKSQHHSNDQENNQNDFCIAHESQRAEFSRDKVSDCMVQAALGTVSFNIGAIGATQYCFLICKINSPPQDADGLYSVFKKE